MKIRASIYRCFGTESDKFSTVLRSCVVNNIVPFLGLWLVLMITFIAYLFSSGVSVITERRQTEVIPYDGWNDTTPFEFDRDELFWFIQITDTHLSGKIPHLYQRFDEWLKINLPAVNPEFVIHTGDIVDAMDENELWSPICPSVQVPLQWIKYNAILKQNLKEKFSPNYWVDLRGNHDNYDVPSIRSPLNYYVNWSVSALRPDPYARVWTHTYQTKKNSTYSFVAMDAAPPIGLSAPMNFYGLLTPELMTGLKQQMSRAMDISNHTFMMGHYPISTLNVFNRPLKNGRKHLEDTILDDHRPTAYLSGHLHLKGLADSNNYFLDLELADFMLKRYYRVLAVDNDLFSYVDATMKKWPVILVTNPKNARTFSRNDKWQRIARSKTIRVLLFSPNPIETIHVYLDDKLHAHVEGGVALEGSFSADRTGLYEFPWDSSKYNNGDFHKIQVIATDSKGHSNKVNFEFHLKGRTKPLGNLYSNIILGINMQAFYLILLSAFYLYSMIFCLLVPKLTYLFMTRCSSSNIYERYRTRMEKDLYKWVGAEQISNENMSAYEEINNLSESETTTVTVSEQNYGTGSEKVSSGAADSTITIRETIQTDTVVSLKYRERMKKNWDDAQLKFWHWALQGLMWHTWRYMHMSNFWFFTMLVVGMYLPSGPLFFGPVLNNNWGHVYMWGMWVDGQWWHHLGALVYGFPLILLIFMPTVALCTAHNDFWRLRVKWHFQKLALQGTLTEDSSPGTKFSFRRAISDSYLFIRLRKTATAITLVILLGIGFMSYSHTKYYGADSFVASPGIFLLSIIAIARILTEQTTSYLYFSKCRGKEDKRYLIL